MKTCTRTVTALAVSGALFGAGLTSTTSTAQAVPKGYWTSCDSPRVGSKLRHHDASCADARRVQRAFSNERTRPYGWDCDYRLTKNFKHFTCAKMPGMVPWVIAWRSLRNPKLVH